MSDQAGFRFPHRIEGLRARMTEGDYPVEAMLVSDLENVRYLSGFTGSLAWIIVTPTEAVFLTDGRYLLQSATEATGFERVILPQGSRLDEAAATALKERQPETAGFEAGQMVVSVYEGLRKSLPDSITLIPRDDAVGALRMIKDAGELASLGKAIAAADACFEHIRQIAKVGMTEKELAWEIEVFLRQQCGATRLGFDSLIGSGPNSAIIHGRAGERKLGESGGPEFLLCDYGCEIEGYNSDITRTFIIGGQPTEEQRRLYEAVRQAEQTTLEALKPGKLGKEIQQVAIDSLTASGYGEYFIHGVGHGLGRLVHDHKAFNSTSEVALQAGMVVTIEPGAYIEGFGGVRIEDDVLITETGYQVLTRSTRDLVVLGE